MLSKLKDLSEFNWILENLDPPPAKMADWQGGFVSHLVPKGFSNYCKIFHSMYVDSKYTDRPNITWDEIEKKEHKTKSSNRYPPLEQLFNISTVSSINVPRNGFTGKRIRWKELAERYGLIFNPGITNHTFSRRFAPKGRPRYLFGPDEGMLDEKTCRELVLTLSPFTGSQPCFFEYFIMATRNLEEDFLYSGVLSDVLEILKLDTVYGSPTYWWPADHSWCLCTDWDATFTILGGSREIIESVLASKELEALRVDSKTRIDANSDSINEKILEKRIFTRFQSSINRFFLRVRFKRWLKY